MKRTKINNDNVPTPAGVKSKSNLKVQVESEAEGSNETEPESEDEAEEDQLRASQYLDTGLQHQQRSATPAKFPRLPRAEESLPGDIAQVTSVPLPLPARPPLLVPSASTSVSVHVAIPAKRLPGRPKGSGKKRAQPAEESDDEYVPPKLVKSGSLKVQGTKKTRLQASRQADGAS